MIIYIWHLRFHSYETGCSGNLFEVKTILFIIIIIISKLFNNGNPSAEAAFQGAVLKIIYKLTYQDYKLI